MWREGFAINPFEFYTEKIPIQLRDRYYSIYLDGENFRIGDKEIIIDEVNNLHLGGGKYKGTAGLWVLLMLNKPNPVDYVTITRNGLKSPVNQI